jgi:hypothetical protein
MIDIIEDAVRVLEAEPTRTLRADALRRRMSFRRSDSVSVSRLIAVLRSRPDRFTVVTPGSLLEDGAAWSWQERVSYAPALEAAGDAEPLVSLVLTQPDPLRHPPVVRGSTDTTLLGEIHDVLAHLLESAGDSDDGLRGAIASAVEELQAVGEALE